MDSHIATFTSRKKYCSVRLEQLRKKIKNIEYLKEDYDDICIYVTGSYGRFEATQYSDLDLFILTGGGK